MSYFLDANCFKYYIDSVVGEKNNFYEYALEKVFLIINIELDDEDLFSQEWKEAAGGAYNPFVDDLIASWLAEGKVRLAPFSRDPSLKKQLRNMGIPAKDARIVEFSVGSNVKTIISEDIDFYEPSRKGCNSKTRRKLICEKKGSVAKSLRKIFELEITCCCHFDLN